MIKAAYVVEILIALADWQPFSWRPALGALKSYVYSCITRAKAPDIIHQQAFTS